ncbi:MAG: hypothetical protein M1829_006145 [Trizodia sp. TS-e1964]|nr:MAG: hypothetical protein M1829_006145 [Trizodia sp. TS-e1964]
MPASPPRPLRDRHEFDCDRRTRNSFRREFESWSWRNKKKVRCSAERARGYDEEGTASLATANGSSTSSNKALKWVRVGGRWMKEENHENKLPLIWQEQNIPASNETEALPEDTPHIDEHKHEHSSSQHGESPPIAEVQDEVLGPREPTKALKHPDIPGASHKWGPPHLHRLIRPSDDPSAGKFSDYEDDTSSFYDACFPAQQITTGRMAILQPPQRILDIRTGTGIWTMQVGETYPSAEVIGTEIRPVPPKWVPPNWRLRPIIWSRSGFIDREVMIWLLEGLGSRLFLTLVNIRFMFPAIKEWPAALQQAYRTLKQGGYIELSELGLYTTTTPTLNEDPEMKQPIQVWQWLSILETAMAKSGFEKNVSKRFKDMLEDAGFVDIVETKFDAP